MAKSTQIPIDGRGYLCGDAQQAINLIGTVVAGNDGQWWQVTDIKTRPNPISIDYIGYGRVVSEKTAATLLDVMAAKQETLKLRDRSNQLAIQIHDGSEIAEIETRQSTLQTVIQKAGKLAEKIKDVRIIFTSQQYGLLKGRV